MKTRTSVFLSLIGVCIGCDVHESEERLRLQINNVKQQLEVSRRNTEILLEVGKMMDSIDRNRFDVLVDWREQPTSFNKYKYRLKAMNSYVVETELKIKYLEQQIDNVKGVSPDASGVIFRLKERIRQRSLEVSNLKVQLSRYMFENKELFRQASIQDTEFDENESRLREQDKELKLLTIRIAAAQEAYKTMQAESCFDQARALEEVANRTRFAGAKKREALEQALALYRRALQLGKEEAGSKVLELEKTMQ